MNKKYKMGISIVSLSVATALSSVSHAASENVGQTFDVVNLTSTLVSQNQINSSTNTDFTQWRELQKYGSTQYTDRIIVKYKPGVETALSHFSTNGVGIEGTGKVMPAGLAKKIGQPLKHVKKLKNGRHVLSLGKQKHVNSVKEMVEQLNSHADVEFAEPDYKRYLMSQNQPWGIADTQADLLTDSDSANMTVCIIDSGYERANPDLNANNATGTNNSGTGNWYQNGGSHGTHVAGTIAAVNNAEGVVGILPNTNVNLHIVKVFNASGWGYTGELVDAVDTCVNNGAKVINMSLGGAGSSTTERNALQAAADAGVLLVAASGNDGDSTLSYPASYDSVMAVGALDQGRQHAEFSQYTSQVEISAPGEAILSTVAGDGRLGYITLGSTTYGNDEVVPQTHYIQSGGSFSVSNVNSSANGVLAACTLSGSTYSCSNVNGNICLAERNDNQIGSNYPEINPAKACADAGASGVIVYSNSTRPGLQNPFLVDANSDVTVPTVSVNRELGQQLMGQLGSNVNLNVVGNQDYAYYNGTSMATPHVAGVAALVWSNNPDCSATQVRNALKSTAIDLDAPGRDNKTGYGLVQAKAASDALAASCSTVTPPPTGDNALENGIAKTGLTGSASDVLSFTMEVPAGATDLSFNMAGGTGDADLYVKFGAEPTTSDYDCRPYKGGNTESCPVSNVQAGTYYVKVIGYSAFSGVSLTGSFTEGSTGGGGATGGSAEVTDITVARRAWTYYTIDVPTGMSTLSFNMSGGTGDADMYIRQGAQPTSSAYDCRPYESGNTEVCNFNNPTAGVWHIGIYGYRAASGVNLNVEYQP